MKAAVAEKETKRGGSTNTEEELFTTVPLAEGREICLQISEGVKNKSKNINSATRHARGGAQRTEGSKKHKQHVYS